jgi:hypothetical protein
MRARKRQPVRPVPRPVSRAAWRLRRWAAAGRELERCDPRRLGTLLVLAEQILRTHRKRRERDLKAEIRRRFARR